MADTAEMIDLSTAADPLRLDNQLCYALYAAAHRMTKSYRPLLERLGHAPLVAVPPTDN